MKTYTIYANASVTKLKEYSLSYGKPETIEVAFIKEYSNEIQLFSEEGDYVRTFRKGTKLLISFNGSVITERTFKMRTSKAKKSFQEKRQLAIQALEKELEINRIKADKQSGEWSTFLSQHPHKVAKYRSKIDSMNSQSWRKYLKMKFAKWCNGGKFEGIAVSAPDLKAILASI